jgi:hypothetical protein
VIWHEAFNPEAFKTPESFNPMPDSNASWAEM